MIFSDILGPCTFNRYFLSPQMFDLAFYCWKLVIIIFFLYQTLRIRDWNFMLACNFRECASLGGKSVTTWLFPLCLRLMWCLCVRRPVGQKGEFKSGSGGGGTRSVRGFARGSVRPGVCVCVCVYDYTPTWEHKKCVCVNMWHYCSCLSTVGDVCFIFLHLSTESWLSMM